MLDFMSLFVKNIKMHESDPAAAGETFQPTAGNWLLVNDL